MKKRIALTVFVTMVVVCALAISVNARDITASGECGDNLTWTLYDDGELVIDGTGDMWDYGWESKDGIYKTTAPWGEFAEYLSKLTIKNGVSSIGRGAFIYCGKLSDEVIIPFSVSRIGDWAFFNCYLLKKVTIFPHSIYFCSMVFDYTSPDFTICSNPDSTAEKYAEENNHQFTEITEHIKVDSGACGDNLTWTLFSDGELAIDGTGEMWDYQQESNPSTHLWNTTAPWGEYVLGLKKLTLNDGLTKIGNHAFDGCTELAGTLAIPESVETIGDGAFHCCRSFTGELNLPSGLKAINNGAFNSCTGFTGELKIPESVTQINGFAFFKCSGFTGSLTISDCVKTIGADAFYGCIGITSVLMQGEEKEIGNYAFSGCSNLKKVTIVSKDVKFGTEVFSYASKIFRIYGYMNSAVEAYATENNHPFVSLNECDIIDSGECGDNLIWTLYADGELVIDGTGDMWNYDYNESPWMKYSDKLTKLSLREEITSIGDYAFAECNGFTGDLVIPKSVASIGAYAFVACTGFTGSVEISSNITDIYIQAFSYCSGIDEIVIADGTQNFGLCAFSNCSSLTKARILSKEAVLGIHTFDDAHENFTIYGYASSTAETYAVDNGHRFVKVTDSGECGNNLTWTLYDDGELVIEGTGDMWNYDDSTNKSPWRAYGDEVKKLTLNNGITSIGGGAFLNCGSITGDLVIPDGVTQIGDYSFEGCKGFTGGLTIPDSVKKIGYRAFYGCSGFTGELVIPDSVISIGSFAFAYCSGFTGQLKFPNSVTEIGEAAFVFCSGFTGELILPSSLTELSYHVFNFCEGITGTLAIPNGVETIEPETINGCSISEIVIPESVKNIEIWAFASCNSLKKVTIYSKDVVLASDIFEYAHVDFTILGYKGSTAETYANENNHPFIAIDEIVDSGECGHNLTWTLYGDGALVIEGTCEMWDYELLPDYEQGIHVTSAPWEKYSDQMTKLIIPEGVTEIGNYAFYRCSGFTGELVLPDSVTSIGNYAFSDCSGLAGDLVIPENVTTIGNGAFWECSGFTGELVLPDSVTSIGESAFYGCSGLTGDLVIPDTVTKIEYGVFWGCSGFTGNLVLGNNLTSIGSYAFAYCSGFTGDLVIPDSVTTICEKAFVGCSGFTGDLVIGDSVTSIGESAFYYCSGFTGDLVIPDTVTKIEYGVFWGCSGFTGKLVLGNNLTSIGSYAFAYCRGFTGDLVIPDSVTTICEKAFVGCSGFTGDLVISDSVTTIGESAFYSCSGLTGNLKIGNSVTTIGDNAFCICSSLTGELVIPDSVTTIGNHAFYGCSGFTGELAFSDSVTTIGENAFGCCSGFTGDLVIPNSVTEIGSYAFAECIGFTGDLVIGNSVTKIENSTFYECSGFKGNIVIGDSVATIGQNAFIYCRGFTGDLVIPGSVTTIGDNAFWVCNGIKKVYFEGNAPSVVVQDYMQGSFNTNVTFYYRSDTTGWTDSEYYDETEGTWNGYKLEVWNNEAGYSISGVVTGYDPSVSTTITLMKNEEIVTTYNIDPTTGEGLVTSEFVLQNIEEGVYDLVITKDCHLSYTIHGISVVEDIDLRTYSNELLSDITLQAGDINEDGCIDIKDVILLTSDNTYNLPYDDAVNKSADINGDNCFDIKDLVIITSDTNYGKSAIVVEYSYSHTHFFSTVVTEPTCTEAGYTTYTCSCGESYIDNELAANGHSEVIDEGIPATDISTGLTEGKHCSVCECVLTEQEILEKLEYMQVTGDAVYGTIYGLISTDDVLVTIYNDLYLKTVTVSEDGTYLFSGLEAGLYYVKVDAVGYDPIPLRKVFVSGISLFRRIIDSTAIDFTVSVYDKNGYYFIWTKTDLNLNTEVSAHINKKIEVEFVDEEAKVSDLGYASFLREEYDLILLNDEEPWSSETISRFYELYSTLPKDVTRDIKSVWTLTSESLHNDITFELVDGVYYVRVSIEAIANSTPRVVLADGQKGSYYSKRLYHAIVRFVTNNGEDADKCECILTTNFLTSFNVPDYVELTRGITNEDETQFQEFHPEEKLLILAMFEEMPQGMHKMPELKYLVRRKTGQSHPIYSMAAAVTWSTADQPYIEFMDVAFQGETGYYHTKRLIIHEKAHMFYEYYFSDELKEKWYEIGGWYRNSEDGDAWSTTKQTEFVSAYAHAHNPNEDMAESIATYVLDPDLLRSRAPAKYEFIRDYIMQGSFYLLQFREDLTFEVYNLNPDYIYPGQIKKIEVRVDGAPEEDKLVKFRFELFDGGAFSGASGAYFRLCPSAVNNNQFYDIYLSPIDETGLILEGEIIMSRYSFHGYWYTDQIVLSDSVGNERYESNTDYTLKVYLDNPLYDDKAPELTRGSIELSLEDAGDPNHPGAQYLVISFDYTENMDIQLALVSIHCKDSVKNRIDEYADWEEIDHEAQRVVMRVYIPEHYSSGTYEVSEISLKDIAGNSNYWHLGYGTTEVEINTIEIITPSPDDEGAMLDVNDIYLSAVPTMPESPNGETIVTIKVKVNDNLSGVDFGYISFLDPQGHLFGYYMYFPNYGGYYFAGDPTEIQEYTFNITLPKGSAPGTWGVYEISLFDFARNISVFSFVEILHFDIIE